MTEIKYHPLVDCDTDGKDKIPMFFSGDETTVRTSHGMYLEEIVPKYYRLRSVGGTLAKTVAAYIIHCPLCGKGMTPVASAMDKHRLALYSCRNCNKMKERK